MTLVMIVGCGGGADTGPTEQADQQQAETQQAPDDQGTPDLEPPEPVERDSGNILRFGTTSIDGRFNPIMANNIYDLYVTELIFDRLISNDAEGNPTPWMATWEVSDDNLTYTFTLMEGITFSDGVPLTSHDVAFTFSTIAHPEYDGPRTYAVDKMLGFEAFNSGATDEFEAITIIDDHTISFTFADGEASPANIWAFNYGIIPEHYYAFDNWGDFLDLLSDPLGSGRFVLDDYRPMEFLMLSARRNHWNPEWEPNIDGILMTEVPQELLIDAFATGTLDFAQPEALLDNYDEFTAMPGVSPLIFLGNGFTYMTFNTVRPQLEDVRVRQALMYALDRVPFIEAVYGPLGDLGLAPISPASWAFPDEGINDYALDLDLARELMAEAGWEPGADGILERDGERMSLTWPVYTEVEWPARLAELATDTWRQIGVELNIELTDFNSVIAQTMDPEPGEKDFDIYVLGFSLNIDPDPSGAIFDYDAFVAGGFNASGFFHEEAQNLITQGRTEFDQDVRTEIYKEWATLMNYYIPSVIIAYRNELWIVGDNIDGMVMNSFQRWTFHAHEITIN